MYKYRINIKKVSGRLNESVLPSKNLVVKSKEQKTDEQVFEEASKFYKEKYGLVIESADVKIIESFGGDNDKANKAISYLKQLQSTTLTKYEPATGKQISQPTPCQVAVAYGKFGTVEIQTEEENISIPKEECKISIGNYAGKCVFINHPHGGLVYIIKPIR